jgi:phosphoserine phosphatase
MSKRDILVVFDIDETLIQYINKNAYHFWKDATLEQKRIIENNEQL